MQPVLLSAQEESEPNNTIATADALKLNPFGKNVTDNIVTARRAPSAVKRTTKRIRKVK